MEDKGAEGHVYRILGVSYVGLGDYHRAIEFAEQGMRITKEMADTGAEGHVYRILAGSYVGLGDYQRRIEYAKKGIRIAKQVGDTHVQYCRTDTDRYLQLTVRKFRTDRHSWLRTVICGWRSVRFAQTVVLTYSPNTERASHYRARANCWRSVHFARTVIIAYGPSFAVDGPYVSHRPSSLLTDRHLRFTIRM